MKKQILKLFSAIGLFCLCISLSYAFDGRKGAKSYDAHQCFADYYNYCVDTVCMNTERRDCRERICMPGAKAKCKQVGDYPTTSKGRFNLNEYR